MKTIFAPCKGFINKPYPYGSITQYFGENFALYNANVCPVLLPQKQCLMGHNGIDIVAPWGTEIYAVEDGEIFDVKESADGYGKHVRILTPLKEDNTRHEWTFGHLSEIKVKIGDQVTRGQCIGLMGNTGFVVSSSDANGFWKDNPSKGTAHPGTHLHLGLRQHNSTNRIVLNYDNGFFGSVDFAGALPANDNPDADVIETVSNLKKLMDILAKAGIALNPFKKK